MTAYRTQTAQIAQTIARERVFARLLTVVGAFGLLLAAIGLHGLTAYSVAQRTSEIGVRLALGATSARVTYETAIDSFRTALTGVVAGMFVVVLVDLHLIRGGAKDLPALIGVPVALLIVCAAACWLPARKAASLSPFAALRKD
jgi:putative ABC transport system permease protein